MRSLLFHYQGTHKKITIQVIEHGKSHKLKLSYSFFSAIPLWVNQKNSSVHDLDQINHGAFIEKVISDVLFSYIFIRGI